jgi:UDP-N-acetylmuramate: L-alanyl-gamma-D-glutamyl-meso-diaminopimelate ligase
MGGAVMHNLALELLAKDDIIMGSDDEIFDPALSRLKAAGILPEKFGWYPEKITNDIDAVILGMHAKPDNPELLKAQQMGIPIYSFPEYVANQSSNKKRVVIAGSHGKTTCTAMLMHILKENKINFDYLVGSMIQGYDRMVKISNAKIILIEGDEYLSSPTDRRSKFLHYTPHFSMITGIAWDHINVFPTFDSYLGAFKQFITSTERGFYFAQDDHLIELTHGAEGWKGYTEECHTSLGDGRTLIKTNQGEFQMPFFGLHNIQNASGVVKLASELGVSISAAWGALENFPGTSKRLEVIHRNDRLTVYRDFAHAPSKLGATVNAVRNEYNASLFTAVFEVHTFSSLQTDFMQHYKGLMSVADHAYVLYDPNVFETKGMEVPSIEKVRSAFGDVYVCSNAKELEELVHKEIEHAKTKGNHQVLLWMSSGQLGGVNLIP